MRAMTYWKLFQMKLLTPTLREAHVSIEAVYACVFIFETFSPQGYKTDKNLQVEDQKHFVQIQKAHF